MKIINIINSASTHYKRRQGMQFAASLSYSTLLSVVPVTMLLFFISLQTDMFSNMFDQVREQLLTQLLPTSREQIKAIYYKQAKR